VEGRGKEGEIRGCEDRRGVVEMEWDGTVDEFISVH
jgi:hypothetical protein